MSASIKISLPVAPVISKHYPHLYPQEVPLFVVQVVLKSEAVTKPL